MNVSRKFPQSRLRRARSTSSIRSLVAENSLSVNDLIQPIFVKEDLDGIESIDSLPGINRYGPVSYTHLRAHRDLSTSRMPSSA